MLPALKKPTISPLERWRLAGGQHHPRRIHRAHHHSAAQRSRSAGHRRISIEQDRNVMIRISGLQRRRARCSPRKTQRLRRSRAHRRADSRRRAPPRRRGAARLRAQIRRLRGRLRPHRAARLARRPNSSARFSRPRRTFASTPVSSFRRSASSIIPDGRRLGQIVRPLDSMGAYTPAGRYPLPSTLLMNVIPAQVAGVKTICVACPQPEPGNSRHRGLARRDAFLPDGRRAGDRGAGLSERKPFRASTASSDRAIFMSPRRRN